MRSRQFLLLIMRNICSGSGTISTSLPDFPCRIPRRNECGSSGFRGGQAPFNVTETRHSLIQRDQRGLAPTEPVPEPATLPLTHHFFAIWISECLGSYFSLTLASSEVVSGPSTYWSNRPPTKDPPLPGNRLRQGHRHRWTENVNEVTSKGDVSV